MSSKKKQTKSEQLAELTSRERHEADPEDLDDSTQLVDMDDYEYAQMAPSKLRRDDMPSAYRGKVVSRQQLYGQDEFDQEMNDQSDEQSDQADDSSEQDASEQGESGSEDQDSDQDSDQEDDSDDREFDSNEDQSDQGEDMNLANFMGQSAHTVEDQQKKLQQQLRELEVQEASAQLFRSDSNAVEMEKAQHVRAQRQIWDNLLDLRIRFQSLVQSSNRFPLAETMTAFRSLSVSDSASQVTTKTTSGSSVLGLLNVAPAESLFQAPSQSNQSIEFAFAEAKEATEGLLDDLLRLDTVLREQNDALPACEYDERAYEDNAEMMCNSMSDFRNDVIEKWNYKTQLTGNSALTQHKFKAINQSVLTQIGSILEDQSRLLKRTQTKRVAEHRLGDSPVDEADEFDEEIFDDNDFYQQLLKDLIASGTDLVDVSASDRSLLDMAHQHRLKSKKLADRRASKGRKIRYTVQPKLVNFMVPRQADDDMLVDELFATLFGGKTLDSAPAAAAKASSVIAQSRPSQL